MDEAHRLKNRSSVLFAKLKRIHTRQRLLLTGTPLQNNLNELWALLSFVLPGLFDDEQQFSAWFNRPFESDDEEEEEEDAVEVEGEQQLQVLASGTNTKKDLKYHSSHKKKPFSGSSVSSMSLSAASTLSDGEKAAIVSALHRVMKPFLLRRVKTDVAPDLPAKV